MHSLAALDQISEKINEELNSDENDTEEEDDFELMPPNKNGKNFDRESINDKR